ncbi:MULTISPECIES: acetoacetate decarboxylase family protein [unclassified Rhodococcus (in: high G+C Gram-positive bacteria)]|uniref:acetoacetate decarboxylase family protein n=1 Tax=unclassified Rhodococcus (in: high G+C Gram-positive bacteria) TaxID=192944 RepID=UPI001C9B8EBE|nr:MULTISPECIES: acetoacetate decarboxylase family protein [unclassified Rhodococcus (in: high G+C Gram-positive bacteria)]MBY6708509.1 acetoacetate decarboxylase family protein [Rhodococcus sp. BP-241]
MTESTRTQDWHTGADGELYPPEPWYLGGTLLVSVYRVPVHELPKDVVSAVSDADARLVTVGGHAVVSAAFVRYTSGGVLSYDELIGSVLVRRGLTVMATIPHIWVDSPQSRTGGRELWSIPKHLGEFRRETSGPRVTASMTFDGAPVAALDARVGRRLTPGTPRIPLTTAQHLGGRTVVSRNTIYATTRALSTTWTFASDGPLGHLHGRTPTVSVALADASIVFGGHVDRR